MSGVLKVIGDFFTVLIDIIYGIWKTLWNLNRGVVRGMMPGQGKSVHLVVTYLVVMLEIVGIWVGLTYYAAQH